MKVAFIVLAYQRPAQLARLVSVMRDPRARIYVHVDRGVRLAPFTHALASAGGHDVVLLRRHPSRWGTAECVDAVLEGLAAAVADGCGYVFLISEHDFPLRPVREIVEFADHAGSRSYLEHWPVSSSLHRFHGRDRTDFYAYTLFGRRELCIPPGEDVHFLSVPGRIRNQVLRARSSLMPPRRFPTYARPFAGATWWNLSRPASEHILRFVAEHPDYRRYHQHTWVPEEVFFQSILLGTDFADRYEVVGDNLRFYRWDGVRARVLTVEDLPAIVSSGKLFARKFDTAVDDTVLARLAERVMPLQRAQA